MMSVKRGNSYCAAFGCSNGRSVNRDLSFFRFPKDEERCKMWVLMSSGADLMGKSAEYLNKNCRLCSQHFEANQFMNHQRNKLVWNAVPSAMTQTTHRKPPEPRANQESRPSHSKINSCANASPQLLNNNITVGHNSGEQADQRIAEQVIGRMKIALVKKGGAYCAAFGCRNRKSVNGDLSFFRFPKDEERCKIWVLMSRRKDLMDKSVEYLNRNCTLCSQHFEADQFMNHLRNKLVWNAMPSATTQMTHGEPPEQKASLESQPSHSCSNTSPLPFNDIAAHVDHSRVKLEEQPIAEPVIAGKRIMVARKGGSYCAAFGCRNSGRDLSFFRFPKDEERCKVWVSISRRKDLMDKSAEHLNKNYRLCSQHFEANQFMNHLRNKLVWNAVPSTTTQMMQRKPQKDRASLESHSSRSSMKDTTEFHECTAAGVDQLH